MTAEVVILNKSGIALAADSAVSIGTKKVYNSANKLFALSRNQPVGIMIYGNAEFMSVPWEALIKSFRKKVLKDDVCPKLDGYVQRFIEFLTTTPLIPPENEPVYVASVTHRCAFALIREIDTQVEEEIKSKGSITHAHAKKISNATAKAWIERQNAEPAKPRQRCTKAQLARIPAAHLPAIEAQALKLLGPSGITQTQCQKFAQCVSRELGFADGNFMRSGVVIAGYGDEEIFPSAFSYHVSGRLGDFLQCSLDRQSIVNHKMQGGIMPFAQREMVDMFMSGVAPAMAHGIEAGLNRIFSSIPDRLVSKHGLALSSGQIDAIKADLNSLLGEFGAELGKATRDKFSQPVLDGVSSLPIDELASMAESLVSLTSFKRKVTMVPESVGGPVDVAVISKGDGFIWIKRKHYFKAELNHQYFRGC